MAVPILDCLNPEGNWRGGSPASPASPGLRRQGLQLNRDRLCLFLVNAVASARGWSWRQDLCQSSAAQYSSGLTGWCALRLELP